MNTKDARQDKVEKPHANFDTPREVIAEPGLSKDEKAKALDAMEQDARQLEIASAEGMQGGERSKLPEVLDAKQTLASDPLDPAYDAVLRDLRLRGAEEPRDGTGALIRHAIEALEAVTTAIASSVPGNPPAESAAEIERETRIEKLDP